MWNKCCSNKKNPPQTNKKPNKTKQNKQKNKPRAHQTCLVFFSYPVQVTFRGFMITFREEGSVNGGTWSEQDHCASTHVSSQQSERSRDVISPRALDARFYSDTFSTGFSMNAVTGTLCWAFKGTVFPAVSSSAWCVSLDAAPRLTSASCTAVTPCTGPCGLSQVPASVCSAGDSCEGLCAHRKEGCGSWY